MRAEHRGVGDLVAVEVQDRQHRAVARRVEELVASASTWRAVRSRPRRRRRRTRRRDRGCRTPRRTRASASTRARRPRGSSRASRARRGSGCRRGTRTGGTAAASRRRRGVIVGVDLGVGALEPGCGDQRRDRRGPGPVTKIMSRSRVADHPVEVRVEELQPGRGAPVAEQPRLHVVALERLAQQRVVEQVDLADGQVVRRAPPGVEASDSSSSSRGWSTMFVSVVGRQDKEMAVTTRDSRSDSSIDTVGVSWITFRSRRMNATTAIA